MIRVRLFTKKEWYDLAILNKEHEYDVRDALNYFKWHLLDTAHADEIKIPFRDAESLQFLRETYGIRFISDGDWYSVWSEESRSDITCLYDTIQYGLAAIDMSKKGIYAKFKGAEDKIWQCLAKLPVDILIASPMHEMGLHHEGIRGAEYIIENYPYDNKVIEVNVLEVENLRRVRENCTEVPECHRCATGRWLYVDNNGKYYTCYLGVDRSFQYFWKQDVPDIIEKIKRMRKDRTVMCEVTRVFDVFELGELLCGSKTGIIDVYYADCLDGLPQDEREGKCKDCWDRRNPKECYEEYLYFKNEFKLICHLSIAPEPWHRKLPVMMVDKYKDGTYNVSGTLTVKNPSFGELFYDIITERSAGRERYILIVEAEELLDSVNDMEDALCGFKVLGNSVEVFDAYNGAQLWGQMLEEAYTSGKCNIDTGFY